MLHGLEIEAPRSRAPRPVRDSDDLLAGLACRIPVYRLLAGVFLEEPSPEFLSALRREESLASLAEAGLCFDADFLAAEPAALTDALAVEYATLFTVAGGFPPVESARLTGRFQQDPFFAVRQTYRQHGFTVGRGRHFVFDDQLGVELSFVAALLELARDALEAGDPAGYQRLEREAKRFWTVHLGKWVRGYARLVQRAAEHSFYREMARLLEAFAGEEIATLGLRIDDLDQSRLTVPKSEIRVAFNPDEPVCNACPDRPEEAHAAGHPG